MSSANPPALKLQKDKAFAIKLGKSDSRPSVVRRAKEGRVLILISPLSPIIPF